MSLLMKDSDGTPSWTITLGVPAVAILTARWLVSGVSVTSGTVTVSITAWTGADYALAVGIWLGFLAQKGWRDRGVASESHGVNILG